MSISDSYDAAKMQSLELAKQNIAAHLLPTCREILKHEEEIVAGMQK